MERIVGLALESSKMIFSLDRYRFRYVGLKLCFALEFFFFWKRSLDQAYPFAYICSFTLYTTYKKGTNGHWGMVGPQNNLL